MKLNPPEPSPIRPIKPPMYRGILNMQTGVLKFIRDDENGKLTYEEIKRWWKNEDSN